MAREPFRLDGAEELIKTFGELTRPTQRNALLRTAKEAIEPLAAAVKARAPYEWGDLDENLLVGTRLTRRQASMARSFGDKRSQVEVHFGTADPAGMMNEFQLGPHNKNSAPFFTPEWEGRKYKMRDDVGRILGEQIVSAGVRAARRRARGTQGRR
jgi:hypothetical protein